MSAYFDSEGNPQVALSVCVLIDFLEISNRTKEASKDGTSNHLLQSLQRLITKSYAVHGFVSGQQRVEWSGFHALGFSDTLVLGFPLHCFDRDCGEGEIGDAIDIVARFLLEAAEQGFWGRGAITIGELHISDKIAFGAALVEAHQLETNCAIFPRVILSDDIWGLTRRHLVWYPSSERTPDLPATTCRNIWIDMGESGRESVPFVSYLHATDYGEDGIDLSLMRKHKERIAEWMERSRGVERYFVKALWACSYHNEFCRRLLLSTHCPNDGKQSDALDLLFPDHKRHFRQVLGRDRLG